MVVGEAYFSGRYPVKIYGLNEQSLTISFGTTINEDFLNLIAGFNQLLLQNPFSGFITTVPAYSTLTVFYDPMIVANAGLPGRNCFEKVAAYLQKLGETKITQGSFMADQVVIPVCYGGAYGPDITMVAKNSGLTEKEVVEIHCSGIYTVFMIGFVPGFAYMGGMDAKLVTPRKNIPDAKISAGAVGIAGTQTGIYPLETPGGWQIIGRTPLKMFDVDRLQPSFLKGGDQVTFKPVSAEEFNALAV